MTLICLQAGHENIQNNSIIKLRSGTGAPGEKDFAVRVRNRLSELLISKGFQVQLTDANFNDNPERSKDFDLFLAIHYDADCYGAGGGFLDRPKDEYDLAHDKSRHILESIESVYFSETGIENKPNRRNDNTTDYYMWQYLSANTPCVLTECGVGQNAHDKVILNDTDRVAKAICKGICKAFNVEYEPKPQIIVQPEVKPIDISVFAKEILSLKQDKIALQTALDEKTKELADSEANRQQNYSLLQDRDKQIVDLQNKIKNIKSYINSI